MKYYAKRHIVNFDSYKLKDGTKLNAVFYIAQLIDVNNPENEPKFFVEQTFFINWAELGEDTVILSKEIDKPTYFEVCELAKQQILDKNEKFIHKKWAV